MQVGKGLGRDEVEAFAEERVGLAGEADHDIGTDGGVGEERADGAEALGVVPGAVAAMHAAEDGIGAGLQGQVGVAAEARLQVAGSGFEVAGSGLRGWVRRAVFTGGEVTVEGEEIGGPVHRLDGTEAETGQAGPSQDGGDEVFEALRWIEIAAPAAEVDA